MLLMAEMIFHLTFEHGLKNGAKNLLQDVLYVFRALDVVVVEDLLSNLLAWGSWWSFTLWGVRIFFWTILVVLTLSLSSLCILLDSCRPR